MVEFAPSGVDGAFRMGFAGDTMNTAWYLKRRLPRSAEVDFLTAVGTDRVSDRMIAFLEDAGIGVAHIARRPDRTVGLYVIQLENGERSFSYWRGQSAARSLACADANLPGALAGATMAYFSGITLAILSVSDRTHLLDNLRALRASGGTIAFDPNLRPGLWQAREDMTEVVTRAAAVSDIVLPSFEDEAVWFGDATPEATARRYASSGARLVVVKNGPNSILVCDSGVLSWHDPTPVTEIVDTTAAGDSFNAGFLASHLEGMHLADSIRAGADLAAKVVQLRGALISDPVGSL